MIQNGIRLLRKGDYYESKRMLKKTIKNLEERIEDFSYQLEENSFTLFYYRITFDLISNLTLFLIPVVYSIYDYVKNNQEAEGLK